MAKKSISDILSDTPAAAAPTVAAAGESVAAAAGGGMLSKLGKFASSHKTALALGAAPLAIDLLPSLLKGTKESFGNLANFLPGDNAQTHADSYIRGVERLDAAQAAEQERARRFRALQSQNTQLLFQNAPHLAAQIMAGRELPEDAVVIGGQPRLDLLQDVAAKMTAGHYLNPDGMGA